MAKGNFEQFLEALGAFESGKPSGDPAQYSAKNPNTNATGKYQFTEVIFADLGYYNADNNLYDGVFNGTWTGKNGVTSLDSWTKNPAAQETAIKEAFVKNYGYINSGLSTRGITSIDGYLSNAANQGAKTVKYYKLNTARNDFEKDTSGNRIIYTQQITISSLSGILAGAHLRGAFGAAEVLGQLNNKSLIDFTAAQFNLSYYTTNLLDEINTPIFKYLDDFGNYTVTNADFTLSNNVSSPSISLAVSNSNVLEDGNANILYTFTRTGSTTNALTVNYNVGGTATFNNDYGQIGAASFTGTTGSITFAAGASTATLTIDPTADTIVESDETVSLTLASGTGYTIGTNTAITGTILNDDKANRPLTLTGDANNNILVGDSANDTLTGLGGKDTLTGGLGADKFRFNSPSEGIDTITDFNPTQGDKIELSQRVFEKSDKL